MGINRTLVLAAKRNWICLQGWAYSIILPFPLLKPISFDFYNISRLNCCFFSPFYHIPCLSNIPWFLFPFLSILWSFRPLWFSDSSLGNYRQANKQAIASVSKLFLAKALDLDLSWLWPVVGLLTFLGNPKGSGSIVWKFWYSKKNINWLWRLIGLGSNPSPGIGCVTSGVSSNCSEPQFSHLYTENNLSYQGWFDD